MPVLPAVIDLSTLDGNTGFRIDGIDASDSSGISVSSAGDVNGDGFDDIIVGASEGDPGGDSAAGESYVVFGKAGGFTASIDLSTLDGTNGFRLDGIDASDFSGGSVSAAGDINGDGFDDIIIGADRADPGGDSSAGESYVVFGQAGAFTASLDLNTLDGTNGFRIDGIDAGDQSGISVSSAGDVNNDGFDDIIIGASGGDPGGDSGAGESYVVFGKAGGFAASFDLNTLNGTNGFRIDGIDASDRSGGSVSSAGDVNGDGFDDIIIGAYGGDPGGDSYAGESYVVFGKFNFSATPVIDLNTLNGTNGFRIDGIDANDESGFSVSSAGDVNGDGFDDIIIGAAFAGTAAAGESYVVFGSGAAFAASLDLGTLNGTNGFRIDGIDASDRSGGSVSSAGDVNGDGFDDLLIGAGFADAGESYIVFGHAGPYNFSFDLASINGTNGIRLDGIDAGDGSGLSVSAAGDVNGDGFDDIIIGARYGDPGGDSSAGESYVVFGGGAGDFPRVVDLASLNGGFGARINGIDGGDGAGRAVSSAGDVNGDGFDDIIIGASGGDPGGNFDAGESYVVFGSAAGISHDLDLSTLNGTNGFLLTGIVAGDESGATVSSAGDINGDGFDDIIIGASDADPGGNTNAGQTYVVFGSGSAFPSAIDLGSLNGLTGFRIDGLDAFDRAFRGSAAGDINGDGFDDLIIGANGGNSLAGETYVIFGQAASFGSSFDLSTLNGTNGFRLDGIDGGDTSGNSVSSAGDVNGDGFDDILIGAVGASPGGNTAAGETYVVFGQAASFGASFDLGTLDGTNGFQINGIDNLDRSGDPVTSAGDVNGDGFDDIIIGVFRRDPGGDTEAGETYVVFGKAGGFAASIDLDTLDGTNGFRLDGIDQDDYSGRSVSSAGDVNGDGFDDLLIGAHGADPGGQSRAGETYVVFGKAGGFAASFDLGALDGTNGFRIDGDDSFDHSGFSVSAAGDLNGDGFDDIVIGAYLGGFTGETYVIYGRAPTTAVDRVGAAGDQQILGGVFDDTLSGLGGADTLDGGDGTDTADYVGSGAAVTVDLGGGTGSGGAAAGDILINIEKITGSAHNDSLTGDGGNNTLDGGDGNDTLHGGAGDDLLRGEAGDDQLFGEAGNDTLGPGLSENDTLDGGADTDTATFNNAPAAVNANLVTGTATRGTAVATLVGIENLIGSGFADTLTGDGGDNILTGGAGGDALDGGGGFDIASYANAAGLVVAFLTAPTLNFGDAAGDSYISIEGLIGSEHNDLLYGSNITGDILIGLGGINQMFGFGGDDTIIGGAELDYVLGGDGNDSIDGGAGLDILVGDVAGESGSDTINGGDDFDQIYGGAGGDLLNGDGDSDYLFGEAGNDTLNGGVGIDYLFGGDGNDILNGDAEYDLLQGGDGNDTLFGGDESVPTTNYVIGQGGEDRLIGGTGIDYMTGGDGITDTSNDTFAFTVGGTVDVILDFQGGAGTGVGVGDIIEIDAAATGISSFAQLQSEGRLIDVGAYGGIVITPGTDVVYLFNVASGTLVADDFAFL